MSENYKTEITFNMPTEAGFTFAPAAVIEYPEKLPVFVGFDSANKVGEAVLVKKSDNIFEVDITFHNLSEDVQNRLKGLDVASQISVGKQTTEFEISECEIQSVSFVDNSLQTIK